MSLKAVHLFFVTVLTGFSILCTVWKLKDYSAPQGSVADLLFALGSILAGVGVVAYGRHFLKKLKDISYL